MKAILILGTLLVQTTFSLPIFGPGWQDLDAFENEPGFIRVKREPDGGVQKASLKSNQEDKSKVTWVINTEGKDKAAGTLLDLKPSEEKEASESTTKAAAKNDVAATTPAAVSTTTQAATSTAASTLASAPAESTDDDDDTSNISGLIIIDTDDLKSSDNEAEAQEDAKVDTFFNKCLRVRCAPPPQNLECQEKSVEEVKPQLAGLTSECCPVHSCKREDGSTFIHYAIEIDEDANTLQTQAGTQFGQGSSGSLPNPPPRPPSLPPFISSLLPPIFPFLPPPSNFYSVSSSSNSNRQTPTVTASASSSRNSPNLGGGYYFPPLSSGSFHPSSPSSSTSTFQIVLPQASSITSHKHIPAQSQVRPVQNVQQRNIMQHGQNQMAWPRTTGQNGGNTQNGNSFDRFVRNIAGGGGMMPMGHMNGFVAASPFSMGPMSGGVLRARRNTEEQSVPLAGLGFAGVGDGMPFRPMTINGFPFVQL